MTVEWNNCYDDSWKDLITPEAFSHPAKFSRGLIQRIYQYCLEMNYFSPGQIIIDPFGGVGLGAIATHYGLNWLGNELESRFCQMAWSWDCPGLLQEDYDSYKGQCESPQDWYALDIDICSECVYKAVGGEQPQPSLFEKVGYFTSPHRYHGNLERFEKFAKDGYQARLTQGDSRKLNEIWSDVVGGLVTSPPYAKTHTGAEDNPYANTKGKSMGDAKMAHLTRQGNYGQSQGQLANMPEGLVTSPPYVNSMDNDKSGIDWDKTGRPDRTKPSSKRISPGADNISPMNYGKSDGQLSSMPEGLVTSPPFAGNTGGKGKASREGIDSALFDRHSGGMVGGMHGSEGNLESMQPGGLVTSPPFSNPGMQPVIGQGTRSDLKKQGKIPEASNLTEGNLEGLVTSPPFSSSVGSDNAQKRGGILKSDPKRKGDKNLTGDYGDTEGQLAAMGEGMVSSPPFENVEPTQDDSFRYKGKKLGSTGNHYGSTDHNIGNNSGPTFWSAAADIIRECHSLLAPNSVAVFVTKNYVKKGKEVDFTGNWQQLCISCGFEIVEEIRAMVVTNLGTQLSYSDDDLEIVKERKSFFRRVAEKKGAPPIDYETVTIMRKICDESKTT